MISDIIIIALFVLFVFIGIRRGAARTVLNLAAAVVCAFLSNYISSGIAGAIYNSFIKQTVITNIESFINQNGAQYAMEHSFYALPDGIRGLVSAAVGMFGVTPEQLQGRLAASSSDVSHQLAQSLEKPVGALAQMVLSVLISAVIFILLMIVFKLIIRVILRVFEIPVVREINMALGGITGALEGIVIILVIVNTLYAIMSYANPNLINNTAVFGSIYNFLCFLK